MNANQIQPEEISLLLLRHRRYFVLAPVLWQTCNVPVELQWQSIRFGQDHRNEVPNDSFGIYAFMLVPDFNGPPSSAYLLYIGKTSRPFRTRYGEYLNDETEDLAARPIDRALDRWSGYVWFHYAPMGDRDLLDETEESLLNACIPPFNVRFTGVVGHAITAFRADYGG